jgi:prepilin-type N-terminal cleavage/methylation domain-containing protein
MNGFIQRRFRKAGGFTLIELLVATALLTGVVATATKLMMASTLSFARENATVKVQQDLAAAKNILLDDLSIAGYTATPSTTFESVTTQSAADAVTFRGDVDSSGGSHPDRICYRLTGGALQRKVVLGGAAAPAACGSTGFETLIDDVSAFTLTFLDGSRTKIPPSSVSEIIDGSADPRYVQLLMTIHQTVRGATISKTIHGEVALRNY